MAKKTKTSAIILAAGSGSRSMSEEPKQFRELRGTPLFLHSAKTFLLCPAIEEIIIVLPDNMVERARELAEAEGIEKEIRYITGGKTRQESSYNGVMSSDIERGLVLIHDAARPFVSISLVGALITALQDYPAVNPVMANRDTIVEVDAGGFIKRIPPRERFLACQTPQGFHYGLIKEAHLHALKLDSKLENALDDCSLILNMGEDVWTVEGESQNIKITYPEDFKTAEAIHDSRL